ncbi:unnamed protein product [Gordionus sp. m RMFG-2023]|uniref:small VCP/p97-interacting protein-like n=1 Tax=Gordionus sp. m RMFG-2023 TaxID=3053472 RepID=UPI0030E0CE7E
MGVIFSCCGESQTYDTVTEQNRNHPPNPNQAVVREQVLSATQKRLEQMESRGIKDPLSLKEKQKKVQEMERLENERMSKGENLKHESNLKDWNN